MEGLRSWCNGYRHMNELGKPSSNPGRDCNSHSAYTFVKGMNLTIFPTAMARE